MALPLVLDELLEAYVVACSAVDSAEESGLESEDREDYDNTLAAHEEAKRALMAALDPIIAAASNYLWGIDDLTDDQLRAAADGLGIDHDDVEALD